MTARREIRPPPHTDISSSAPPQGEGAGAPPMGGVGPGGGWGKWGNHTLPPTNPHSKSSSNRTARGPQGAAKLIQEKKAGAAGAPLPGPHLWGLAKKKGGSGGWKCPPPLRALTPRKEASHPALALQGMLGGTEGRSSFPPPHSFCCHDP